MLISIEGNIGSGKSTFLRLLQKRCEETLPEVAFVKEPVDEWILLTDDTDKENILQKFYKDLVRWSYSFQMNAFITRSKSVLEAFKEHKVVVSERSIISDCQVFATMLKEDQKISTMEWKLYEQWYHWLQSSFPIAPAFFVYLRANPHTSYERMKHRDRKEEDTVPFEYIKRVAEKHDQWLTSIDNVMIIDVDDDFEHDLAKQDQVVSRVMDLLMRSSYPV